jgi:hypothetical protein
MAARAGDAGLRAIRGDSGRTAFSRRSDLGQRPAASGAGHTIPRCFREQGCRGSVVEAVSVDTFIWTNHALLRLSQRRLDRLDVEEAIRANHDEREDNDGRADWLIRAMTPLGVRIEAIYDHPVGDDDATIRVVSAWRMED